MDTKRKKCWIDASIQLFLGLMFIVSGVLKSMDIYGTELKLIEYGNSLGWDFLINHYVLFAIILCTFELWLGLWLSTFFYRKIAILTLITTMLFFTTTTIFFVINHEKNIIDCGCFGELFPMSLTASLLKNCLFLLLSGYLLWAHRKKEIKLSKDLNLLLLAWLCWSILLPLYTAYHLSLYNPTGHGEGTNLREKTDSVLLDQNFEDVKEKVLNSAGQTYIFVLKHQPDYANRRKIQEIMEKCKESKDSYFVLSEKDMNLSTDLPCYHVDEVLLKSLVRSHKNGVVLLDKRVVKRVWEMDRMWEWE